MDEYHEIMNESYQAKKCNITVIAVLQSSQGELSKLREELGGSRRERAALSARAAELKAALTACLQHVQVKWIVY